METHQGLQFAHLRFFLYFRYITSAAGVVFVIKVIFNQFKLNFFFNCEAITKTRICRQKAHSQFCSLCLIALHYESFTLRVSPPLCVAEMMLRVRRAIFLVLAMLILSLLLVVLGFYTTTRTESLNVSGYISGVIVSYLFMSLNNSAAMSCSEMTD